MAPVRRPRVHDPDHLALRGAVRATLVVTAVFAICDLGLDSRQAAVTGVFGAIAFLVSADFGGPMASRLRANLGLAAAGYALVALGTACSHSTPLATLVTGLVAFGVLFAGVLSGYVAAGGSAAVLMFVLPVMIPAGAGALPDRLIGWTLPCARSIAALTLLWPERPLRVLTMAGLLASVIAGGAGALILPYLRLDLGLGPMVQPVFLVGIVALGITTVVAPRLIGFVPWKSALVCALAAQPMALVVLALADGARQAAVGYGALLGASALVGLVVNSRRAGHVHRELRVPIGLAGGAVNARAGALGALLVGLSAVPLGEARAYLLLAVISLVAGVAALTLAGTISTAGRPEGA